MLAPPNISVTAVSTTEGKPWPPNSGLHARPCQPFLLNSSYASLKPGGVCTTPGAGMLHPCWSPAAFSGAITSDANWPAAVSTWSIVAASNSGWPHDCIMDGTCSNSCSTNWKSRKGLW
jgi:hypothetical protein